jgi:hypothetical protein
MSCPKKPRIPGLCAEHLHAETQIRHFGRFGARPFIDNIHSQVELEISRICRQPRVEAVGDGCCGAPAAALAAVALQRPGGIPKAVVSNRPLCIGSVSWWCGGSPVEFRYRSGKTCLRYVAEGAGPRCDSPKAACHKASVCPVIRSAGPDCTAVRRNPEGSGSDAIAHVPADVMLVVWVNTPLSKTSKDVSSHGGSNAAESSAVLCIGCGDWPRTRTGRARRSTVCYADAREDISARLSIPIPPNTRRRVSANGCRSCSCISYSCRVLLR